jgi:hypothetical protein
VGGDPPPAQGITLDHEKAEQLRADLEAKRKEAKATASAKTRGPVDSGKGVRIQVGWAGQRQRWWLVWWLVGCLAV